MIWQFNYHRGPAPLTGFIETVRDEESVAFLVAQAWCERNSMRPPAGIKRMILADESILGLPSVGTDALPDAVAATTAVNSEKPTMASRIANALR